MNLEAKEATPPPSNGTTWIWVYPRAIKWTQTLHYQHPKRPRPSVTPLVQEPPIVSWRTMTKSSGSSLTSSELWTYSNATKSRLGHPSLGSRCPPAHLSPLRRPSVKTFPRESSRLPGLFRPWLGMSDLL